MIEHYVELGKTGADRPRSAVAIQPVSPIAMAAAYADAQAHWKL